MILPRGDEQADQFSRVCRVLIKIIYMTVRWTSRLAFLASPGGKRLYYDVRAQGECEVTAETEELELYKNNCWHDAVNAFGTSRIFERRANLLKRQLRMVNFIGLAVPVVLGGLLIGFGEVGWLKVALGVAAVVGVGQLVVNAWSLVAHWIEDYSYALNATSANASLALRFRDLARNPSLTSTGLKHAYEKLQAEDGVRQSSDTNTGISQQERNMGMRAALREFGRSCAECGEIPKSMVPTDCPVCGRFDEKMAS